MVFVYIALGVLVAAVIQELVLDRKRWRRLRSPVSSDSGDR